MKAADIRRSFLEFFQERGHTLVPSSPVVPQDDPTLLFANAGMNQFKDVFLGQRDPGYTRAASSQKCIRAGGKHNDLENVGQTARHHTFFEMLGNFSFGGYFKAEAIAYAWEFVTGVLGLDKDRLWPTVYEEDNEAAGLWERIAGLPDARVTRLGADENYWSMGETGPCGPCSEIIFDRGADHACGPDCRLGRCDCDRWLEIWNLVFMQFDRDAAGTLTPLPKPSIDTGMGLERVTSVIQGVDSNYSTDLFAPVIAALQSRCGRAYDQGPAGMPFRVVGDHLRALAFAIADGALPSNEGRGYVLRRILRRAARFGRTLDIREPFIHELLPVLAGVMGDAYPELLARAEYGAQVIRAEEESFGRTLDRGIEHFDKITLGLGQGGTFPGDEAFFLHDTCGFPIDLTSLMAAEKGLQVDLAGFQARMGKQVERARAASSFAAAGGPEHEEVVLVHEVTAFSPDEAQEPAAYQAPAHGRLLAALGAREQGGTGALLLDKTVFYPEGGGQVGDTGTIRTRDGSFQFQVEDTVKLQGRILHRGRIVRGTLPLPHTELVLEVQTARRAAVMRAHTATHLLHRALHEVVGGHALQQGSLVEADRLRFDFTHFQAVGANELERIETLVNELVVANLVRTTETLSLDQAKRRGAMALFGEKYGDRVRMVSLGGEGSGGAADGSGDDAAGDGAVSRELCGGTHVARTGDIGFFWILREGSVASGVRRIEALTGAAAVAAAQDERRGLRAAAGVLGADPGALAERLEVLKKELKDLKKGRDKSAGADLASLAAGLWDGADKLGEARLVAAAVPGLDAAGLRALADQLRGRNAPCLLLLAAEQDGKALLVAAATKDLVGQGAHAGKLVKAAAACVSGGGGGRPDLAEAGGKDPAGIPKAVETALATMREQLGG